MMIIVVILIAIIIALLLWQTRSRGRDKENTTSSSSDRPTRGGGQLLRRSDTKVAPAGAQPRNTPIRIVDASQREVEMPAVAPDKLVAFIDVETTGLTNDDRIVSIAVITMVEGALVGGEAGRYELDASVTHLVFNPQRPNNPAAQAVHGWTDEVLARQPLFARHAQTISERLASADLWVMHNVPFDSRCLRQEFERIGRPLPERREFCTMQAARRAWPGEPVRLDECSVRVGCHRAGPIHGAAEDALLAAALYLYFRTGRTGFQLPRVWAPTNYVA
jgi:DNA polymerase-3 subunit epsilon